MFLRTEHDIKLMHYVQGALLGEVAPSFRAVFFKLSRDCQDLVARFIFDGEPSKDAKEVASVALTNLLANYSQNHRSYKEEMLVVPHPEKWSIYLCWYIYATKTTGTHGQDCIKTLNKQSQHRPLNWARAAALGVSCKKWIR